jgi:phosphatidylglycerophosphate synthase
MHNVRHSVIGLYGHAILLSLPPALLVWAILLFTLSIVISVMHGVGQETAIWRKVSIWSVLAIFVVLLIIVCLALYTFSIIWKFQSRTARLWNRFTDILTRRNTTKFEPAEENV